MFKGELVLLSPVIWPHCRRIHRWGK